MRSQKGHSVALVRILAQPHPDQMNMIRHQAIARAEQPLTSGDVQHQFAKRCVKTIVQPAAFSIRNRQRPMDNCITLIKLSRKAWKIEFAVEIGARACRFIVHRSSRGNEAQNSSMPRRRYLSLLTSAATTRFTSNSADSAASNLWAGRCRLCGSVRRRTRFRRRPIPCAGSAPCPNAPRCDCRCRNLHTPARA